MFRSATILLLLACVAVALAFPQGRYLLFIGMNIQLSMLNNSLSRYEQPLINKINNLGEDHTRQRTLLSRLQYPTPKFIYLKIRN